MRDSGDVRVAQAEERVRRGAVPAAAAPEEPAAAPAPGTPVVAPAPPQQRRRRIPQRGGLAAESGPVAALAPLPQDGRASLPPAPLPPDGGGRRGPWLPPLPAQLPQSEANEAGWQDLAQRMRARQASRAAAAEAAAGPEEPAGPATPTAVGDLARAWNAVWGDDEDRMVDFLSAEASEQDKEEAARLYELLLVNGATAAEGQAKVSELFSVPRVTKLLRPNMSLGKGLTFDLHGDIDGRSWDFLKAADRREAMTRIREQRPYLVIGSPPCTAFSQLNDRYRRMDPEVVKRRKVEGRVLLEFAAQVDREQLAGGHHFLHEHPAAGTNRAFSACAARLGSTRLSATSAVSGCSPRGRTASWDRPRRPRGSSARPLVCCGRLGGDAKATTRTCSSLVGGAQLLQRYTRAACAAPSSAASRPSAGAKGESPSESRGRRPQVPESTRSRSGPAGTRRLSRAPACAR